MPLQETSGAASYDAFGGGVAAVPQYIEDVFSTYLYTGNSTTGGTQTITNNIDLSTKGGMVWVKGRSAAANNMLYDTTRDAGTGATSGTNKALSSNLTSAEGIASTSDYLSAFSTTGFSVTQGGATTALRSTNYNAVTYASWTFRKQPKFFDVVTYTGNGANRTISHSLGSTPACIIVKRTDTAGDWQVYHRSLANTEYLVLNTTAAKATGATRWNSTTPTSTVFSLGTDATVNASGGTYVAYIFAHDAGGFGLTGTDNVISCGEVGAYGSTVNLGWEPQWILLKRVDSTSDWYIFDTMRGLTYNFNGATYSLANTTAAETTAGTIDPITNGFVCNVSGSYIYIAIRRGPMKVPTSGTSVFVPYSYSGNGGTSNPEFSFSPDTFIGGVTNRASFLINMFWDRIRGSSRYLQTSDSGGTQAEVTDTSTVTAINPFGVTLGSDNKWNGSGYTYVMYPIKRAPSFFDVVCYTGTGSALNPSHNLGVIPELKIIKSRSGAASWVVGGSLVSGVGGRANNLVLNTTAATGVNAEYWDSADTATTFSTRAGNGASNASGLTYVAYLFASCPGVSKVGSYTGTGTTKQIDCGFTAGARFVMIKRTDSTGDWHVWDTARGIVAGNDPYNLWNVEAAQVTSTDYVDAYAAGFELSSTAPAALNASGGTYIFLAIA